MTTDGHVPPASIPAIRTGAPDLVLRAFRRALEDMYGDRLDRVVLFGARARGDARPDADYDVAVFLKTLPNFWEESDRLADLQVRFFDDLENFSRPCLSQARPMSIAPLYCSRFARTGSQFEAGTEDFFNKAMRKLRLARRMIELDLAEDAARTAYIACFHVAQAIIFDRSGKIAKTHKGVQAAFYLQTGEDAAIDHKLRSFLGRSIATNTRPIMRLGRRKRRRSILPWLRSIRRPSSSRTSRSF